MSRGQLSSKSAHNPSARKAKFDPAAVSFPSRTSARRHPWNVVHACEVARKIMPLLEGQLAAGMRPQLLTPAGLGVLASFAENSNGGECAQISLLQTWNHVREWRKLLNESSAEISSEVIHAHSFAAGMAAVRSGSGVVYQFNQPVEKLAAANGGCDENSWLARSFRVAEQFVLTRAAAVVVNSHTMRLASLDRGLATDNVFLIPDPVPQHLLECVPNREWMERVTEAMPQTIFFVVPSLDDLSSWQGRDALMRWMRVLSVLRHDYATVRFVFFGDASKARQVYNAASACNLSTWVSVLPEEQRTEAIASSDVVICDEEHADSDFALEAMACGRALLAADIEQHRDISPEGRGCLWHRPGEVADIARRASFLAANPHFRRALGIAAREHCLSTRSPEVVGAQYDLVYRLAFSRRKGRDNSPPKTQLIPLQVGS